MNVVLAGSMLFIGKMQSLKQQLEDLGCAVTLPIDEDGANNLTLRQYNEAALERLKAADVLLVVNEDSKGIMGRVGSNTLIEIGMAFALKKPIYLLNNYDASQDCASELAGLTNGIVGSDSKKWLEAMK